MKNIFENFGLYLDYYELTMAQGYFLSNRENVKANFDYFFRKNPFNSGYTVFAGLSDLLELIQQFKFGKEALDYLHEKGFKDEFLDYLKDFSFKGNIFSVCEGEIVFPYEPVLRVEGNIIESQVLESLILNVLNFESLITTKARRLRYAAKDKIISDFGLRRGQGLASLFASKAAVIGGINSTSNVLAAFLYDLTPAGTQAHSWIQSFDDELTAFRKYAEFYPDNCVLLVDTIDTLKSGIPNAIIVAKDLEAKGKKLKAIRLDSGDLAFLSKKARKILDDAGLDYVEIVASNQLDEYLIKSLLDQNAPIDFFGVGTSLITGRNDAALDGVYKISMIDFRPTIKISEDIAKVTLPGVKTIYRYFNGENKFYADCIALVNEKEIQWMQHPFDIYKKCNLENLKREELMSIALKEGKPVKPEKSIKEIADYVEYRFSQLPEEHKRFEFPHIYKVGLSPELLKLRDNLLQQKKDVK